MEHKGSVHIVGTGHAAPEHILDNEMLSQMMDTSDEWITTRTGIKRRHIAAEGESNSQFAAAACESALAQANCKPEEIDFIFAGTVTGDLIFPSLACLVQDRIGAKNAAAWDLSAACSGFLFSMATARAMLMSGKGKKALVIGSEVLSRITNWADRSTCVLFGDGAGAILLEYKEENEGGILSTFERTDGGLAHLLNIPRGGSDEPITAEIIASGDNKIQMKGNEVYKHAVRNMGQAARNVLAEAGKTPADVDLFIPHQANIRIMKAIAERLEIAIERVFVNITEFGNTSAASIPIALDEARTQGRVKPGDLVLMATFGGGLTWGAALIQF